MIPLKALLWPAFLTLWAIRETSECIEGAAQFTWGAADRGIKWMAQDARGPRPDEPGTEE